MHATRLKASDFGILAEQLNKPALEVLEHLQAAGFQAYVVGGFARDILSGWVPKDFDIATNATPEQVVECVPRSQLIGRRFKLVHAYSGRGRHRHTIEIATFRASDPTPQKDTTVEEQSSTPTHAELKKKSHHTSDNGQILRDNVYGTIEDDVLRRDFTANALYYDPSQDLLLDFMGSIKDIQNRTLRIIGEPAQRFTEDPVRVIRAIRFVAKLGWEIEPATEQAMYGQQNLISKAAPARLFDEILKLMLTEYAWECWLGLERYGVDDTLFPHAAAGLAHEPFHTILHKAAHSTGLRIAIDKPVNPAFIYAVLLWPAVVGWFEKFTADGMPVYPAMQKAGSIAIEQQQPSILIPRRFALVMKEMWVMQISLGERRPKQVERTLSHARFRAAYDFFEMRSKSQCSLLQADVDTWDWWTLIQKVSDEEKQEMIQQLPKIAGKKKRRVRRKS